MATAVLTFIIFLLFMIMMAIGFLVKRQPLQKRCAADPNEPCTCGHEGEACLSADEQN